ncbi:MAG: hypothetical protein LC737_07370 [Chloroflexi bacterium]|nr:hypothetical protein [Chloroflexota bacterium]
MTAFLPQHIAPARDTGHTPQLAVQRHTAQLASSEQNDVHARGQPALHRRQQRQLHPRRTVTS